MDHPVLARMTDGTAREATPGLTASPATVATVRSGTCGADCVADPCTLRDMRAGQRAGERHPGITLWAELAVLAHLTGWPMPIPQDPLIKLLTQWPARLRDCALSQAVDQAVASRTPLISARVSPPALAAHVVTAMRVRVSQGMWLCPEQEPQWLAPAPRLADGTVPEWEEQSQPDLAALRPLAFGLTQPSAIEQAIGTADFGAQLTHCLDQEFTYCKWPLRYLRRLGRVGPAHPATALGRPLFLVQATPGAVLLRAGQRVVQALHPDRAVSADGLGLALADVALRLALAIGPEEQAQILVTARAFVLPAPVGPGKRSRGPPYVGHGTITSTGIASYVCV
jgi:hypothetical protein